MPAIVWADIGGGLEVKAVHLGAFQPFDERRLALASEAFADLAHILAGAHNTLHSLFSKELPKLRLFRAEICIQAYTSLERVFSRGRYS